MGGGLRHSPSHLGWLNPAREEPGPRRAEVRCALSAGADCARPACASARREGGDRQGPDPRERLQERDRSLRRRGPIRRKSSAFLECLLSCEGSEPMAFLPTRRCTSSKAGFSADCLLLRRSHRADARGHRYDEGRSNRALLMRSKRRSSAMTSCFSTSNEVGKGEVRPGAGREGSPP
jgi:hypothetical protein